MIIPKDECLREVAKYDDSEDIAKMLEQTIVLPSGYDAIAARQSARLAIDNLRGMHDLLRSMKHHLAINSLDNA